MLFTWVTRENLLLVLRFLILFCLFFVIFNNILGVVSLVTTNFDKIQSQSHLRPCQIKIVVPIRLKLKFSAVFMKWGSRTKFLLLGRQEIVNYWTSPPWFLEAATKGWFQKFFDMINEICLWNCLFATVWFVWQKLLERLYLPTLCLWLPCVSCYHYQNVFKKFASPRPLKLSWNLFYH